MIIYIAKISGLTALANSSRSLDEFYDNLDLKKFLNRLCHMTKWPLMLLWLLMVFVLCLWAALLMMFIYMISLPANAIYWLITGKSSRLIDVRFE